MHFQVVLVGAW
jgi:hypothetical protein